MSWAIVGGAAIGAIGSYLASDNAADKQADAANAASGVARQSFLDTEKRNQPFYEGGTNALATLLTRLGIMGGDANSAQYGNLLSTVTPQSVQNDPGYQWAQQQGQQGIERWLAAKGLTNSGRALKAASQFNTGNATKFFNDAFTRNMQGNQQQFNMLQAPVGWGQASANQTGAAGQAMASTVGNNLIGAGDAQAAGRIGGWNALQNGINQGVSAYTRSQQPGVTGPSNRELEQMYGLGP
jgi:hypothetical protein